MGDEIHIRGTGIVGPIKGLRIHRQRALEHLPERLHRYLSEKVRIADWYPLEDHLDLLRALIEAVPITADDPWSWMGEQTADFDLVEVYPSTIQHGNPRGTLRKLPEVWQLYHDAGELQVTSADERGARIDLGDFAFTSDEYCRLLTGFFAEALRLSGAQDGAVRCVSCGDDRACWEASW